MRARRAFLYSAMLIGLAGATMLAHRERDDDDEPDQVALRIRDEMVAPDGVVQLKVERYEVTPISGGRPRFSYDESMFEDFVGFGMFAPTGELAGAAIIDGNRASVSYVTTRTAPGDLPLLTVALRARRTASPGSRSTFTLDPSSTWTLNGQTLETRIDPATVTVGGSLSISSVIPGQGVFPAGTAVTVQGAGFNAGTRLRVEDVEIIAVRLVSPTEMQFTLARATDMTGKRLRADNRDGSRVYYHAYMRSVPEATSARPLLSRTVPIVSGALRSVATFGPLPEMQADQYVALALLNPRLTGARIGISVYSRDGSVFRQSELSLGAGHRLALELSEFFEGVPPPAGAVIQVTASQPIGAFGMICDERAYTVNPVLANEATR